ncbi:hypothetical protein CHUV0807_2372 [Cardiobacterium hominis]|uniref:Uncharacterized protein n=1 Tax=Cardiobacterium hominis TaxID=2718 RepID=A0A1C3H703_9GAMM|nr:hypothetical protein [Cardiobacterium hominis]SAM71740.1 hypothetical protein CHUV0807_2372 [Cardiobacterium hominis]
MNEKEARNIAEKIQIELVARGIGVQLIDWMSANGIAKVVMTIEMEDTSIPPGRLIINKREEE